MIGVRRTWGRMTCSVAMIRGRASRLMGVALTSSIG
jgi:hypothetical protein